MEDLLCSLSVLRMEEDTDDGEELFNWWDIYAQEILPRFPAKYLLTLKTVCKNSYRIISSPEFVRLHLKMCNERRIRILIPDNPWGLIEYNSGDGETKQLTCSPSLPKQQYQILGSCDGLLCLLYGESRRFIALYNPSTGECCRMKLPRHPSNLVHVSGFWFGYHLQEYILVLGIALYDPIGVKIQVYKFTRTSEVELIHSLLITAHLGVCARGTFLHGVVHWPATRLGGPDVIFAGGRDVIFAYCPRDNKYFEILPPVHGDGDYYNIGVVHGCLCAISMPKNAKEMWEFDFEFWVMKRYRVEHSWTKYANLRGFNCVRYMLSPLGLLPNGDLILDVFKPDVDETELVRYSFNHNKPVLLVSRKSSYYNKAIICAESLVSPRIFEGRGGLE